LSDSPSGELLQDYERLFEVKVELKSWIVAWIGIVTRWLFSGFLITR
jgi:hypothetical protein